MNPTTSRSIADMWDVIHDWLKRECPSTLQTLNQPASEDELTNLEKTIGLKLPEDFKSSYRIHNGSACYPGPIIGVPMLPVEDIMKRWIEFKTVAKDWEEMLPIQASFRKGMIKEDAINPNWIPFLGPDEENYVGLDFDPGSVGTRGQVINFGADELKYGSNRFVLAPSFGGFLNSIAELFNDGKVVSDSDSCLWLSQPRSDGGQYNLITGIPMLFGEEVLLCEGDSQFSFPTQQ